MVAIFLTTLVVFFARSPNEGRLIDSSYILRSESGEIINLRLTPSGHWREEADLGRIDRKLIDMLVAYEDKRFWSHFGVDLLALGRSVYNILSEGKVSSGASTITMQTVRLMHPELGKKNLKSKVAQIFHAVRLDLHWSKSRILKSYFTLAPYGSNIEGIEAASQSWFGKTPKNLTYSESAFLVALPQSPEKRRPDLFYSEAMSAKSRVLKKVKDKLKIPDVSLLEYIEEGLPREIIRPRSSAQHLADRLKTENSISVKTTINHEWQNTLTSIFQNSINAYPEPINIAGIIVERKTGKVRSYIGSSNYSSSKRKGAVNYLLARRSPGSTLKPLIYAKGIERGFLSQDYVFEDTQIERRGYVPSNFDKTFSGKVTLKESLHRSLNIPAIETLELLGPELFESDLRSYLNYNSRTFKYAGLSLAVGGFYISAEDLAEIFLEISDPSQSFKLQFLEKTPNQKNSYLINKIASDKIIEMMLQPSIHGQNHIFKTGTSHERQDAWTIQIFEEHIVLVWVGTPDNEPTRILTGRNSALPISVSIGEELNFQTPTPKKSKIKTTNRYVTKEICPNLIEFPQNGEWIKSSNLNLSIGGDLKADWYINGEKIPSMKPQVKLKNFGLQKITAVKNNCSSSVEIFLDQVK